MRTTTEGHRPREPALQVNNVYGMLRAVESGLGLASLPDYLAPPAPSSCALLPELEGPSFTAYFVYPEELRSSKRVAVFRDFLLEKVAAAAGLVGLRQRCMAGLHFSTSHRRVTR